MAGKSSEESNTAPSPKASRIAGILWLIAALLWFINAVLSNNRLLGVSLGAMFLTIAYMNYQIGEKARKQGK
jgi:hypothetical protein